jgi:hypothetical protein
MKKTLMIVGGVLVVGSLIAFLVFGKILNRPGKAALQISTTPDSEVLLNGERMGVTPFFNDELDAGDYTLRLVPQDANLYAWEGQVSLVSNIVTSVSYQLGQNQDSSSGQILSLEKGDDPNKASLSIVSDPNGALVKLNGESKGFAPVLIDDLGAGEYEVTVFTPGYLEQTITPQTVMGYKLTVSVKLAREEMEGVAEATPEGEEGETEEAEEETSKETGEETTTTTLEKPYVKILETPTGWLRVRLGPSTSATEAAKVKPNETYPYLGEEENGWYKIEYEKDEEGWISGVYADLVD